MIRGLGSQLIQWPAPMIAKFVAAGFQVVAFDNRDAGLSQKCDDPTDYTLVDMAQDTIGLMDALGLSQAHVLGMSMGGSITLILSLRYPDRILSATVVMSSSRAAHLPQASPEVLVALRSEPPSARRQDVIAHGLAVDRLWQSPRWPFDEGQRAALIGRLWDRCYCPEGAARQYRAMVASESALKRIEGIRIPLLVVHGTQDALVPIEHGRDIAARVRGARLVEIDGMGHDLGEEAAEVVARHTLNFLR
nr:alpha/beta hydrolase [Rhodobacter sp. NTK016B]